MIYKTEFGNGVEKYRPIGQVGESRDKIGNKGKAAGLSLLAIGTVGLGCGCIDVPNGEGIRDLVDTVEPAKQQLSETVKACYEDGILSESESEEIGYMYEKLTDNAAYSSTKTELRHIFMEAATQDNELTETEKFLAHRIGVSGY
ncbi:MAG: hypothetical protein KAU95_00020 [Candidatus Aenigmarchaeota archaeon]|nr:hypothetical protein [Candidatus Aenigmarchaeota archaeon]